MWTHFLSTSVLIVVSVLNVLYFTGAVYYYNEIDADPSSDLHQNNSALGYQGYSTTYGKFFNEDKDGKPAHGVPL